MFDHDSQPARTDDERENGDLTRRQRRGTMCSARCARNARGARAVDRREQRESSKMMCETSWGVPESARASSLHAEGKGVNLQRTADADCAQEVQLVRAKAAAPL